MSNTNESKQEPSLKDRPTPQPDAEQNWPSLPESDTTFGPPPDDWKTIWSPLPDVPRSP